MADPLLAAGIPVTSFHKPQGVHLAAARRIARLTREFGADVLHTHNPQVHHYGVLVAKMAGVKGVVNTLHGVNNLANADRTADRTAHLIYALTGPWTDCIATVSQASCRF